MNTCKSVLIFTFCFLFAHLYTAASGGTPIKPLTQVNKEFLVVVHIVRAQDKTPAVSEAAVLTDFIGVNSVFNPIAVSFKVCEFRYIDNYHYDTLEQHYLHEWQTKYNVTSRINVYYGVLTTVEQKVYCGYAALHGISTPFLTSINIGCTGVSTLAHEMGHFFGLKHTFEGNGTELANGSNCDTDGDLVCDTPADPYSETGPGPYLNGCVFISMQKDANGDYYDPDVHNIMSYYSDCLCLTFSHGQYERMASYYLSHPVAW